MLQRTILCFGGNHQTIIVNDQIGKPAVWVVPHWASLTKRQDLCYTTYMMPSSRRARYRVQQRYKQRHTEKLEEAGYLPLLQVSRRGACAPWTSYYAILVSGLACSQICGAADFSCTPPPPYERTSYRPLWLRKRSRKAEKTQKPKKEGFRHHLHTPEH